MTIPLLTAENYYGQESSFKYISASQLKAFLGTPGIEACEERALAELNGQYERKSNALLLGSLLDVMLTGTDEEIQEFKDRHPEMFSSRGPTKGQLKAEYRAVEDMVARAFADRDNGGIFMKALTGEKQRIVTGEIHGHWFKGRIDVLGDGFITDLKSVENVNKRYYNEGWWDFISWWGYDLQGAVYQELVYQETGRRLPFYLATLSKQVPCDIDLIQIPQWRLDDAMGRVTPDALARIEGLKVGELRPQRCEHCDWCRMTKVIKQPRILEVV